MGLFNKKKEREKFKAKLTYGDDIVSLYEESKRIEKEVHVQRARIQASEEWQKKEQLEEQQRFVENKYEALLGRKHGFDVNNPGTYVHVRDWVRDYNRCDESPFGYHTVVWLSGGTKAEENTCLFCKKVV